MKKFKNNANVMLETLLERKKELKGKIDDPVCSKT
jgi:hypothetical protein